jgi:hypothetical protein
MLLLNHAHLIHRSRKRKYVRSFNVSPIACEHSKHSLNAHFTNRVCSDAVGCEHKYDCFAPLRVLDFLASARESLAMSAIAEDIGAEQSTAYRTSYWRDWRIARAERTSAVAKPSVNLLYTGWRSSRASPRRSCPILNRARLKAVRSSHERAAC